MSSLGVKKQRSGGGGKRSKGKDPTGWNPNPSPPATSSDSIHLPPVASAATVTSSPNSLPYHPSSLTSLQLNAVSGNGAIARSMMINTSAQQHPLLSSSNSHRSTGGSSRVNSSRKPGAGTILRGLDADMMTPPRSSAAQAAMTAAMMQQAHSGGPTQATITFNPSPIAIPALPTPPMDKAHVNSQFHRKQRLVVASFDISPNGPSMNGSHHHPPNFGAHSTAATTHARPKPVSHKSTANLTNGPSSHSSSHPTQLSSSSSSSRVPRPNHLIDAQLDAEEAKLAQPVPVLPVPSATRALLPEDVPDVFVGEEDTKTMSNGVGTDGTFIPSPSLYTAPPASLFALVATPVNSNSTDSSSSSRFQFDTKKQFIHIHSSNSDHGTASSVLSTKDLSSANVNYSPSPRNHPHAHHHQSLSSTPLPDDQIPAVTSPSPTINFFSSPPAAQGAGGGKQRTLLSTIPAAGMTSPAEEENEFDEDAGERDQFDSASEPPDRTFGSSVKTDDELPNFSSVTPSANIPSESSVAPTPVPNQATISSDSTEPNGALNVPTLQPIIFNVTVQLVQSQPATRQTSDDATTTSSTHDVAFAASTTSDSIPPALMTNINSNTSLISSLLPLLLPSEQTLLTQALHDHQPIQIKQVKLEEMKEPEPQPSSSTRPQSTTELAPTTQDAPSNGPPHQEGNHHENHHSVTDSIDSIPASERPPSSSPVDADATAQSLTLDLSPIASTTTATDSTTSPKKVTTFSEPSTSVSSPASLAAAAGVARGTRAQSLFVPKVPVPTETKLVRARTNSVHEHPGGLSAEASPASSASPRSNASSSPSTRGAILNPHHVDLAKTLSRKRVSFFSKSLHALAREEEVDEETHDLLTNDLTDLPSDDEEQKELLQAHLDQDVLLEDDTFGLAAYDVTLLPKSIPPNDSPSQTKIIVPPRSNTAHAITSATAAMQLVALPMARSNTSTGGPKPFLNHPVGEITLGSSTSNSREASPAVRFSSATTAASKANRDGSASSVIAAEDTELMAIQHSTLLVERLKLEPLFQQQLASSSGETTTTDPSNPLANEHARDLQVIYDKILSHLLRLKKMITRRHYKSRETLQRKLVTITDDNQVVDWISSQFLSSTDETTTRGGRGGSAHVARPSTTHHALFSSAAITGASRTAASSPVLASRSHGRHASSHAKFAASSPTSRPSLPKELSIDSVDEGLDLTTVDSKPETNEVVESPLVINELATVAEPSEPTSPESWTSPFSYPLGSNMLNAITTRPWPTLDVVQALPNTSPELMALLATVTTSWNFDPFALNLLSDFHPVATMGVWCFTSHPTLSAFVQTAGINLNKVFNFLIKLEEGYLWSNPYHNAIHAVDVLQNVLYFLSSDLLTAVLTPLDVLAVIIGALAHDYKHLGQTNSYLVAISHPLALLYNDQSILEHQSLTEMFKLLQREDCNFLDVLPRADVVAFRSSVVSMILDTDMKKHVAAVNLFEQSVMRHRNSGSWFSRETPADRKLLLDFALHVADLGNPAKPLRLSLQWSNLITTEYYMQGDAEREHGLPISPMMDKNKPSIDLQQYAFINVVVLPLFSQFSEVINCGKLTPCIENLIANRNYYSNRMNVAKLVQSQAALLKSEGGLQTGRLKPVTARELNESANSDPNTTNDIAATVSSTAIDQTATVATTSSTEPAPSTSTSTLPSTAAAADSANLPPSVQIPDEEVAVEAPVKRTPSALQIDPETEAENALYILSDEDSLTQTAATATDAHTLHPPTNSDAPLESLIAASGENADGPDASMSDGSMDDDEIDGHRSDDEVHSVDDEADLDGAAEVDDDNEPDEEEKEDEDEEDENEGADIE